MRLSAVLKMGHWDVFPPLGPNVGFDKKWRGSNDGLHHCDASPKYNLGNCNRVLGCNQKMQAEV